MDQSLVMQCDLATRRGDTLSLVDRSKAWTKAFMRGASQQLSEKTCWVLRREAKRVPKTCCAVRARD